MNKKQFVFGVLTGIAVAVIANFFNARLRDQHQLGSFIPTDVRADPQREPVGADAQA